MKGIRHWMNKVNRFGVIELHYSADSKKDPNTVIGRKWVDDAKQGMPTDGWDREYEINWASGAGKPVYSDYNARQAVPLKWRSEFVIHRGWDRGFYRPACHWSCLDECKTAKRWLWLHEKLGMDMSVRDFIAECMEITVAKFPDALIIDWFPPDTKTPSDMAEKDDNKSFWDVAVNEFNLAPRIVRMGLMDRINIIRRRMLLRADGEFGLLVDKNNCPICVEALQGGYHRNPKEEKGEDIVKDGYYDHLMDAASHTAGGVFTLTGEPLFANYLPEESIYEMAETRDPVTGFIQ
jgi:hypothetical protein